VAWDLREMLSGHTTKRDSVASKLGGGGERVVYSKQSKS
jgi:hypothetical protein